MVEELLKAIKAAPLNLDDYAGGRRPTLDDKARQVVGLQPHAPLALAVDDAGVVGLRTLECVRCGSRDLQENGTNPRTVDLPYAPSETVRLRRYRCNACGEDFTTPLQGVGKKNTTRTGSGPRRRRSAPRSPSP